MRWDMQGLKRQITLLRDVNVVLTGAGTGKLHISFTCLKGTVEDKFECYRLHSKGIFGGIFLMLSIELQSGGVLSTVGILDSAIQPTTIIGAESRSPARRIQTHRSNSRLKFLT
jgi:hypothetical protein